MSSVDDLMCNNAFSGTSWETFMVKNDYVQQIEMAVIIVW